jgi:hypothetical protein
MDMKRTMTVAAVLTLTLGLMAGPAAADLQPHPHALIVGMSVEMTQEGPVVSWRKCVDLAGGNALTLRAHHENVHAPGGIGNDGRGINVHGIRQAGHAVAPYTCAQLLELFG